MYNVMAALSGNVFIEQLIRMGHETVMSSTTVAVDQYIA